MFDILFQHVFICGCTEPTCSKLYDLAVGDEPNVYLYLDDNICKVVDFIGTKYSIHPKFECCPYGDGSLVKLPSQQLVQEVTLEYKSYFNIKEIKGAIHQLNENKTCEGKGKNNENIALDAVCQLLQSAFSGWKDEVERETNKNFCRIVNYEMEREEFSDLKLDSGIWNDYSSKIFKEETPKINTDFTNSDSKVLLNSKPWVHDYGLHTKVPNPLLHVVSYLKNNCSSQASLSAGWTSLKEVWGIGPAIFSQDEFRWLQSQTSERRDCLLLNLAISDLSETTPSVQLGHLSQRPNLLCLRYLAGTCQKTNCVGVHPTQTPGWNRLRDMWGISYLDIDPYVLTYLCQQSNVAQESILTTLSSHDLRTVRNFSQFVGEMVNKYSQVHCA